MAVCRTRRIGERNEEWNEERENPEREYLESLKPGMRNSAKAGTEKYAVKFKMRTTYPPKYIAIYMTTPSLASYMV
jgi:hypothetical protein